MISSRFIPTKTANLAVAIGLLLFLATGAARSESAVSEEDLMRSARSAISGGQLDQAQRILQQMIDSPVASVSARVSALNLVAGTMARQGRLEEARRALEQALALDGDYDLASENLGDVLVALAVRAYAKAERTRASPRLGGKLAAARGMLATEASEKSLLAAVEQWRAAWQARNVEAYLAAYSSDFRPQEGRSIEQWRQQRTRRLAAAKSVRITLEAPILEQTSTGDRASASFTEHLVADNYRHSRRKTLDFVLTPAGWRIVREKTD